MSFYLVKHVVGALSFHSRLTPPQGIEKSRVELPITRFCG